MIGSVIFTALFDVSMITPPAIMLTWFKPLRKLPEPLRHSKTPPFRLRIAVPDVVARDMLTELSVALPSVPLPSVTMLVRSVQLVLIQWKALLTTKRPRRMSMSARPN